MKTILTFAIAFVFAVPVFGQTDVDLRLRVKGGQPATTVLPLPAPAVVAPAVPAAPVYVLPRTAAPCPTGTCAPVMLLQVPVPVRTYTYRTVAVPCETTALVPAAPVRTARYRVVRDGPLVRVAAATRTLFGCD